MRIERFIGNRQLERANRAFRDVHVKRVLAVERFDLEAHILHKQVIGHRRAPFISGSDCAALHPAGYRRPPPRSLPPRSLPPRSPPPRPPRPPPPPPCPPRPPPAPPPLRLPKPPRFPPPSPRGACGRASFTCRARPSSIVPFSCEIARAESSLGPSSTNPNPRERPVPISRTTRADCTSNPWLVNICCRLSSVTSKGRFPT